MYSKDDDVEQDADAVDDQRQEDRVLAVIKKQGENHYKGKTPLSCNGDDKVEKLKKLINAKNTASSL